MAGISANELLIPIADGLLAIMFDDIVFIESKSNYSLLVMKTKVLTVPRTLKQFEEKLPQNYFIRIHNSFIINIKYLKTVIRSKPAKIILKNNKELPLAESRKEAFFAKLEKIAIFI